ncbi:MAG TPA: PadR family transcriptional regulator [Firmicutes bacterium]|jgi:PadR family transcriptional regulator PadR|nr:PadR family transcriptional regulator [Bacillota bacterium]
MPDIAAIVSALLVELRRGTSTLAVLSQLQEPQYGYSLLQQLEARNVAIEAGTLYPLLRRLEKQQLLQSAWDTQETRPRKYYVLSDMGVEVYRRLVREWRELTKQMDTLLQEVEADGTH